MPTGRKKDHPWKEPSVVMVFIYFLRLHTPFFKFTSQAIVSLELHTNMHRLHEIKSLKCSMTTSQVAAFLVASTDADEVSQWSDELFFPSQGLGRLRVSNPRWLQWLLMPKVELNSEGVIVRWTVSERHRLCVALISYFKGHYIHVSDDLTFNKVTLFVFLFFF